MVWRESVNGKRLSVVISPCHKVKRISVSSRVGSDKLSHRVHSRGVSGFDRLNHPVSENVPVAELVEAYL